MITRVLWVAFILVLTATTAGFQLDRQSRYVPTIASSVPSPFKAFSQYHATTEALLGEQDALALEEARELVARRPMPAAHLRLLSIAEYRADEPEGSVYSIQLAGRRGWRDRPTQRTMLELALAAGDEPEAARRYAALFVRRSEEEGELRQLAENLFRPGREDARATFAEIVTGADRWHRIYLRKAPVVLPADALLDITQRAKSAGARFDCTLAEQSVKRLSQGDANSGKAYAAALGCL